ncbi:hypothetical protein LguiA_016898 [Lonicera macranthoides]
MDLKSVRKKIQGNCVPLLSQILPLSFLHGEELKPISAVEVLSFFFFYIFRCNFCCLQIKLGVGLQFPQASSPKGMALAVWTNHCLALGWGKPPVVEFGPSCTEMFSKEPEDKTMHWGDLEKEEEEEVEESDEEEELKDGIQSVDILSNTPTGVESLDVIGLRKQQKKEQPEKALYQIDA